MRNPFRGGLVEKIVKVDEELPDYLAEAIDKLRRFPTSKRIIDEAIATAKYELNRFACPIPLITKRAVVVYEGSSKPNDQVGLEYRKELTIPTDDGKNRNDSYRFYVSDKDEPELYEICVSRENRGLEMIPVGVEFLAPGDRVLCSYKINGGSELAIGRAE